MSLPRTIPSLVNELSMEVVASSIATTLTKFKRWSVVVGISLFRGRSIRGTSGTSSSSLNRKPMVDRHVVASPSTLALMPPYRTGLVTPPKISLFVGERLSRLTMAGISNTLRAVECRSQVL